MLHVQDLAASALLPQHQPAPSMHLYVQAGEQPVQSERRQVLIGAAATVVAATLGTPVALAESRTALFKQYYDNTDAIHGEEWLRHGTHPDIAAGNTFKPGCASSVDRTWDVCTAFSAQHLALDACALHQALANSTDLTHHANALPELATLRG